MNIKVTGVDKNFIFIPPRMVSGAPKIYHRLQGSGNAFHHTVTGIRNFKTLVVLKVSRAGIDPATTNVLHSFN